MPQVTEQHDKLSFLEGHWRGEAKLFPSEWDPKGGTALDNWLVYRSLDGFFLLVDYTEERDGKIVYRGHGVHTWDAQEQCYMTYWFDNIGTMPKEPSRGAIEGSRYIYTSNDGPMGTSRFTYEVKDGVFEFRIDRSQDGKTFKPMHEGRYRRV